MSPCPRTLLGQLRRLASPPPPDAALLARWVSRRDEAAFAALVDRHGPMVLGLCRRVLGDAQHAEDAFQATFLVLALKAHSLRRPEALPSFLYGVALRLARKARGTARRSVPTHPDCPAPSDPRPDPLDVLSGRELLAVVDEEIARLPQAYRLPLLLCVLQERTVEEAARVLGWAAGSVRGRLARGRELLRRRLARRGLAPSAGAVALLEPVAVSERLRAECVRNLAAPAPAAVGALAAPGPSLKLKAICFGLLAVAAGLGAGLPLLRAPEPEPPAASAPAAPQAKSEPRRDRYGDPLPPGAVVRLGTLRFRAPSEIATLAFTPDGKTLAVSSHGGLFLFDAADGRRIKRLPSATPNWQPEEPLAFSPDGKRLAGRGHKIVGRSALQVVRVWELAGERQPREFEVGQWVVWLGWSAEGQPLAIRVEDGALHLHDLAAGRSRRFACEKPVKYPSGLVSNDPPVACSPAGQVLALVDDEAVIHLWDTSTGRERGTLRPKGSHLYSMTFSPDGRRLVTVTPQTVQMWDVASAKALYAIDSNEKYLNPLFSADGKTIAVIESWQTIRFWDAATGRELGRTKGKSFFDHHYDVSADGKRLATVTRHGSTFDLWDVATGEKKAVPAGHTSRPFGTFAPDGRRVASSGGTDGTFRVWDAATGEPLLHLPRRGMARDGLFSADGRSLIASWSSGPPALIDAATGQQQHVFPLEDPDRPDTDQSIVYSRLSDDGKTLTAFSFYYPKDNGPLPRDDDTLITAWDVATRKQLFQRKRKGRISWIALSPDARVLAVPHQGQGNRELDRVPGRGPMRLEDAASGELLLTFPAVERQTWPLAFSADGRLLASNNSRPAPQGEARNTLRLWEVLTAAEVLSLPAADFDRVAFARDNRLMAVAAPGPEIVVWDLSRGRELRRFKGFDAEVIDLSFSPDGRRLVSGLADSTLLVWDVGPYPAPADKLGPEAAAKAWADLASTDAPRAFRARGALANAPEEAVRLCKEHLRPIRPADAQKLRRLLADLESDQFAVREKAQAELEELAELAEPALRRALEGKPTLEVRRRVQAVLERLRGPVTRPEMLRSLRAAAVLEDVGTPAANSSSSRRAAGAPEARLTREAGAALTRLGRRAPSTP
jgi:RNA polymerase sigma factor (sigma-70 family)